MGKKGFANDGKPLESVLRATPPFFEKGGDKAQGSLSHSFTPKEA
jgi:hypothetical protein